MKEIIWGKVIGEISIFIINISDISFYTKWQRDILPNIINGHYQVKIRSLFQHGNLDFKSKTRLSAMS